ncbi:protein nanos [Musca vetustissima]|uniref:protein nanos n=1 Tax=Musca vetustissima TaxID=27455 RepID=UPI002AB64857|nr:protein nanos [Musca vetustissima]
MYRSSPESKKQQPEMLGNNMLGLDCLHMKCFQEMYLDACNKLCISPTPSMASMTDGTTSSGVSSLSPTPSMSSSSSSSPEFENGGGMMTPDLAASLYALQQQQLLAAYHKQQQQLAASAAIANHSNDGQQQQQPQPPIGTVIGNNENMSQQQQQDEICKSLQMFAMLSAYSNEKDPSAGGVDVQQLPKSPVDDVMNDFACNGYVCDELNRYHLGLHLSNAAAAAAAAAATSGNNIVAGGAINNPSLLTAAVHHQQQQQQNGTNPTSPTTTNPNVAALTPQQLQQHNINMSFNHNFWKILPAHMQQHSQAAVTAAAAAAAAAVNIDYNCNQNKKMQKRYNGPKNEKYSSAKHCVFCENNNEPDAVVKSHAVRDSMGRVLCPKLRTYICPICKASGDKAHTVKYCPQKPIITMEDAVNAESFRLSKGTYYKQQMKV